MNDLTISKSTVYAGFLGILGALLVGIGEFSLHYTPSHVYHASDYLFFLDTSERRLALGHFLTVHAMPLYYIGYWHLFKMLQPAALWIRSVVFALGVISFSIATGWIGARIYLALTLQAKEASQTDLMREKLSELLKTFAYYDEALLSVVRIAIAIISVIMVILILKNKTQYPKYFALFNPILLVAICFITYFIIPSIGGYIMPVAMNVAHLILFTLSTFLSVQLLRGSN